MKQFFLLSLVCLSLFATAQNVGIGTSAPDTKLDVAGAISVSVADAPAAAAVVIPDNVSAFRLTNVAGGVTTVLSLATPQEGQFLTIVNLDDNDATFLGNTIAAGGGVYQFQFIGGTWRSTNGADGATGATGAVGPQGTQGTVGATGGTGAVGPQGPAGPAGANGNNGIDGIDGTNGTNGANGATGGTGPVGPQGPAGAVGPQGPQGNVGPQGPVGLTGAAGPQGAQGIQGIQGPVGAVGPQGPVGLTGAAGPQGPIGLTGAAGPQGAVGPAGAAGPQGVAGPAGAVGPAGPAGSANISGTTNYVVKFTGANSGGNSSITDDGTTVTTTSQLDVEGGTGTSYITAPIEVRTTATPRVSFHWPGVVASQIGMESSGRVRTYNNPGTDFEAFAASDVYANAWFRNNNADQGLYNQATGRHFYSESGSYWTAASANGMIFRNGHAGTITGYTYHDGGSSFGLLSPSGNWRFRCDNSNTEAYGGFYFGAGYGEVLYDRNNTGYYLDLNNGSNANVFTANESYVNGWFRVNTGGGIYWQAYGGGWNMQDGTWLRTYGDKAILASGGVAGYGNSVFGAPYGTNPQMYAGYNNASGGGIMVADDGGFFDYNDGWIQYRGSTGLDLRSNNTSWNTVFRMGNQDNSGNSDKLVTTGTNAWGLNGGSGNAWWQAWSYSFNNASLRELKKDINPVAGSLSDLVMADIDKMHPYLYRYKLETDEWSEQNRAKYHPGLHLGLLVDDAPDYVQSQSFEGVDVYAVATLGVAGAKANRNDIKQIKQSIGLSDATMTIQDFGSKQMSGTEMFVAFDSDFAAKLGNQIPVITVSANLPGVTLSVTEKTSEGFRVVATAAQAVSFDYIAMAKVKNILAEKKEEIAPEVMSRIRVSDEVKSKVRHYWNVEAPENQKALEDKAREEAKQIQQQRKDEVEGGKFVSAATTFDVAKDAADKKRLAEDAKSKYIAVPEDAPAKAGNLANPNPSKMSAPKPQAEPVRPQ